MPGIIGPDDLSGWEAAPPAARARGALVERGRLDGDDLDRLMRSTGRR